MAAIVVTGGTGFLGRHIVDALRRRGDAVTVLSRRPGSASLPPGIEAAGWDPRQAGDWYAVMDGKDAVVHLAGEPAVGQYWTESTKRSIHDSRVESTKRIVEAIAHAEQRPAVLLSASGVDYYGHHETGSVDEGSPSGDGFLAEVTRDWEAAANQASELGVRVVCGRFGIVLGRDGGALTEMVKPFKWFVGGPIGDGRQIVSWIHVDDLVGIVLRCLDDASIEGPVNVTAPNAVSNRELSQAIGAVLHRPASVPVPAAALKLRFGEGAEPLLTGRRVEPARMKAAGYDWKYAELGPALEQALG